MLTSLEKLLEKLKDEESKHIRRTRNDDTKLEVGRDIV